MSGLLPPFCFFFLSFFGFPAVSMFAASCWNGSFKSLPLSEYTVESASASRNPSTSFTDSPLATNCSTDFQFTPSALAPCPTSATGLVISCVKMLVSDCSCADFSFIASRFAWTVKHQSKKRGVLLQGAMTSKQRPSNSKEILKNRRAHQLRLSCEFGDHIL